MASVFFYHVVGDLTVGKPELVEFLETETVEASIKAIAESMEGGIPVWRKPKSPQIVSGIENVTEPRQQRFVGILNSLDIVAFLVREECLEDQEKAMKTLVSQVVVPNSSLLKEVDPATRLIDALEMMKQGVRRLLVRKSIAWKGMSKRFSVLYNGKWLRNSNPSIVRPSAATASSSSPPIPGKFCCLSREDVIRFLIGCLGALAPLPLSPISSLGAINPDYLSIDVSLPAAEAARRPQRDPGAVAVTEPLPDGRCRIVGEISACRLWKCDHLAAAWALANLSAGQFVTGVEDNVPHSDNNTSDGNSINCNASLPKGGGAYEGRARGGMLSRRASRGSVSFRRNMYRGRSAALVCHPSSSLAAVMAQMLSHRATHVWVTESNEDYDDVLVGLVGYADILAAVTRLPAVVVSETVLAAASVLEAGAVGVPEAAAASVPDRQAT